MNGENGLLFNYHNMVVFGSAVDLFIYLANLCCIVTLHIAVLIDLTICMKTSSSHSTKSVLPFAAVEVCLSVRKLCSLLNIPLIWELVKYRSSEIGVNID